MTLFKHCNNRFYYFVDYIDNEIEKDILKFRNIALIIEKKIFLLKNNLLNNIIKFCKKNKINFYIEDNYKIALKLRANGVYLSSKNKKISTIYSKKLFVIGHVHSQKEFFFKKLQNCNLIMLSSIFNNTKYNKYKILGISKFNLMSLYWKKDLCCLGGINSSNLKQIRMLKVISIGFKRFIKEPKKKPVYFLSRRVNF